jgi:type II secretory pathway predicted ATPase ExeA
MIDHVEIHRRHAQLRAEFVRNEPFQALADQFDRQLQRRRAVQSLELVEEARGIAVIGAPGSGKSMLVKRVLTQHPELVQPTAGNETIEFVSILVPSPATVKDLGLILLEKLGYPSERKGASAGDIWRQVRTLLQNRKTLFLHLDEAHHLIASQNKNVREGVVDMLKTLLNSETWPVGLILSGTPKMLEMLNSDVQLGRRVDMVKLPAISWASHAKEVRAILITYVKKARLELDDDLDLEDLLPRLVHAGGMSSGLPYKCSCLLWKTHCWAGLVA